MKTLLTVCVTCLVIFTGAVTAGYFKPAEFQYTLNRHNDGYAVYWQGTAGGGCFIVLPPRGQSGSAAIACDL